MQPYEYPRRILLAVTGLSPQVVTETLYALAVGRERPFVPTEVHLFTTGEGGERARLSLLSEDPGWFGRMLRDYDLPSMNFGQDNIHLIAGPAGEPLEDIRSIADNELAADAITEAVRTFTEDPSSALHVSIAGGRKTMGYYLGYALSLFGRPQDRLSHVLVSQPFERSWEFFYPTPYSRVIATLDDKLADTSTAEVTLAEIPFVRLRDGLPKRLLSGAADFGQTVSAAQRAQEAPELVIDLARCRLIAGGEPVNLPPASLAFYSTMARRRLEGEGGVRYDTDGFDRQLIDEYRTIAGDMAGGLDRLTDALARGMDEDDFNQRKSRTNGALKKALGPALAEVYLIHGDGDKPSTRFGLRLESEAIWYADAGELPTIRSDDERGGQG